jgi:serine/threonine protein kinase
MASRVQNVNGNLSNILSKEQNLKYNVVKPSKLGESNLKRDISIDNFKKLTHISSYNESNIKNSENTLNWDDESVNDDHHHYNNSLELPNEKNYASFRSLNEINNKNIGSGSKNDNSQKYKSFDNKLERSVILKTNYEDLTQLDSSLSLYDDNVEEEEKYMLKCPSCPEKVFRKSDDMTVFEKNNEEIDFYTNEKVVSNNCWSEISKLRHYASMLELYSAFNKKSKLTYNFMEEFALGEGINYLSDFGFHDSDHLLNSKEEGFYPLKHSNDYIHDLDDSDSDFDSDSDRGDITNYMNQKRKIIEKLKNDSEPNKSSSNDLHYSTDLNTIDDSKNTLISSFNSLQINQNFGSDEKINRILEVFDFIKEYKKLVNSVSIKFTKNKILINNKPLENRHRYSLDDYQEIKTVGNGAYGKLVECIHLPTNKTVILKRIPVSNINHWYINNVMTMEEYSLRKNIHPRIITLHDAFFYYPDSSDRLEAEKAKSITAKAAKSQSFAKNIKNKFKNLNKVLRGGGKKKKRKDKEKESDKGDVEDKNKNPKEEEEEENIEETEGGGGGEEPQEPPKPKNDEFVLVTEYLGKGSMDLYDYIETTGPIPENNVRYIFAQIIEAVYFMSKNGFSHGDIKDENILIDPSTFRIKLIDFGSATTNIDHAEIPYTKFRGTRKYQAPNIYDKDTFDPLAQDVWSLGVMLFVMLFAADPFASPEEAASVDILDQLYENIQYLKVEKGMTISEEAIDLIIKMLDKDETSRITLQEIIYHSFFRIMT